MSCCYDSYLCLLLDFASNYFTVAFFHCKRCAFIRSKPHYCQTQWFQRFFVGWLIMLGRGDSLSLQELCFQYVEAALLPNTLVSEFFCGLAHHVGKRWLSFIARVLWVGSSCWEEVTLFHCKSCAFSRSKPRYCQTHWFQTHHVGKRWLSFIARAVLSVGRSRTIAKQTGFRCFLWSCHQLGN